MARYRALTRGQSIDGRWRQPGETFEQDGPKGAWMQEIDKDGKPVLDKKVKPPKPPAGGAPAGRAPAGAADYTKLSLDELKAEAAKRKIGIEGMDQPKIIEALRAADADA